MGFHEPPSRCDELEVGICQLNVEVPNQFHQGFVHLHYAYVPARADSRALAEL